MEQHARAFRPRRRCVSTVVLVATLALLVASCGGAGGSQQAGQHARASSAGRERPLASTTTSTAPTATPAPVTAAPTSTAAPASTVVTTTVAPGTRVVDVVDGDTVDVAGGERVRLIGIDTPERGECGYGEAAAVMRALVGGKVVRLVPGAPDDRDRYGRLLRYVEVDGVDVNLEMIRRGFAIARYDSRDGYGRHSREPAYIAADAASTHLPGCGAGGAGAAPAPSTTLAPPAPGGATDPQFRTCRDAIANGYGPYTRGVDPEYDWYRDADRDGIVCER